MILVAIFAKDRQNWAYVVISHPGVRGGGEVRSCLPMLGVETCLQLIMKESFCFGTQTSLKDISKILGTNPGWLKILFYHIYEHGIFIL